MPIFICVTALLTLVVMADWDEDHLFYKDENGRTIKANEIKTMPGHDVTEVIKTALPSSYINTDLLPDEFDWGDVNGVNYLTESLNQHIPQYCGSCWAHGTVSALADRIKIQRITRSLTTNMPDINLAVQVLLNCGSDIAGTCLGGSAGGVYQYILESPLPFSSCQNYIACSYDSEEGFCSYVDTTCTAENTCSTCDTFACEGGGCYDIDYYPNASIAEYGGISGVEATKAEIFARGPVASFINAIPLLVYTGGIIDLPDESTSVDHIVSIYGWGFSEDIGSYWKVRNSWGEYWGELGFFRIKMGGNQLGIEEWNVWAVPESWTEKNTACFETGQNCNGAAVAAMGWTEAQYKANVGRFLKDSDSAHSDHYEWDATECEICSEFGVTFEAESGAESGKISMQISTLLAIVTSVALLVGFLVTVVLRWYYLHLKPTARAGLSLQLPREQQHDLYVVEN